jgi:hypothetical protein
VSLLARGPTDDKNIGPTDDTTIISKVPPVHAVYSMKPVLVIELVFKKL